MDDSSIKVNNIHQLIFNKEMVFDTDIISTRIIHKIELDYHFPSCTVAEVKVILSRLIRNQIV